LKYLQERKASLKRNFQHQAISFKLADMATQMAAKMLCLKAARKDQGIDIAQSGAMAKLFALKQLWIQQSKRFNYGGNGYVAEYHVERMMRDAKITQIYEGTSEIQRIVIRELLVS
jgi:alkylation response protein AidB-like acyl-CoA dehydrogenase